MNRILSIVESAYRDTPGRENDALWVAAALESSGAVVSILLRGNAVNYVVRTGDGAGAAEKIETLTGKGVMVYAVREDARDRGLDPGRVVSGIEFISRTDIADLVEKHDRIWYW